MAKIVDAFGNPTSTETVDETNDVTTAVDDPKTEEKKFKKDILFIQTPIFLLFAEYLGFVSKLLSLAEDWCNPSKPMPKNCFQTLLDREAKSIYDEMLVIWSEDEINKLYRNFYTCGLDELELDLNEKRKKFGEDLPF